MMHTRKQVVETLRQSYTDELYAITIMPLAGSLDVAFIVGTKNGSPMPIGIGATVIRSRVLNELKAVCPTAAVTRSNGCLKFVVSCAEEEIGLEVPTNIVHLYRMMLRTFTEDGSLAKSRLDFVTDEEACLVFTKREPSSAPFKQHVAELELLLKYFGIGGVVHLVDLRRRPPFTRNALTEIRVTVRLNRDGSFYRPNATEASAAV